MVAIIKLGKTLRSPFYYNERKVKAGEAEIIHSANYGKDTDELSPKDRIARLEKLAALNERAQLKSAHVTLNFHPSERLDKETLQNISDSYMRMIGFGRQPYIVYEHKDAYHPHVHILSTIIRADGNRVPSHRIVEERSEPACLAIELEYNLIRPKGYQFRQPHQTQAIETEKVHYGRSETNRAILRVLESVLAKYRFTSLPEFNAVLRNYNVVADDGRPGSPMHLRGGLVYCALDERGSKVGAAIKASDLFNRPTLKFLENLFAKNAALRQPHRVPLQQAIDHILSTEPPRSIEGLEAALNRQHIQLIIQRGRRGMIDGLTYIDHNSGAIFSGSDLGREYSASRVMERIAERAVSPLHLSALEYFMPDKPRQRTAVAAAINPAPKEETQNKTKKKRKRLHL